MTVATLAMLVDFVSRLPLDSIDWPSLVTTSDSTPQCFDMYTFPLSAEHLSILLDSIRLEAVHAPQMLEDVISLISAARDAGEITDDEATKLEFRSKQRAQEIMPSTERCAFAASVPCGDH